MKILIISPNFPPDNTPDMHRIRMMLPYLVKQGHQVVVLAVDSKFTEAPKDALLLKTIPNEVKVYRTKAIHYRFTRKLGFGHLAIRSFVFLLSKGNKIIRFFKPDIAFFSTTTFLLMPLALIWKRKFGLRYLFDFQDPWRNDYYKKLPKHLRPPKYWAIHRLNSFFEKATLKKVDGIIAVNGSYIEMLEKRYPNFVFHSLVLPLGTPLSDFKFTEQKDIKLNIELSDNMINAVYIGVVPDNMFYAIEKILLAVKIFNSSEQKKIKLYFIGTNYAPEYLQSYRVLPIAKKLGIEDFVFENPSRLGYLHSLRLMQKADLLLLPGTTDKSYTASKFFVYLLAFRPILILFHKQSPLYNYVRELSNLPYICFDEQENRQELVYKVFDTLTYLLNDFNLDIDQKALEKYTDKGITKQFIDFIEKIMNQKISKFD